MPARRGDWDALSAKTRARWRANFGGKGTPAQRDARAERAYREGYRISRERAGHEPESVRAGRSETAFVGSGAEFVSLRGLTRGEATRLGRYNAIVGQLAAGRVSPAEFRRRVGALRPIRGERFTSDPDAVLARLDQLRAADRETFVYRSGRAA